MLGQIDPKLCQNFDLLNPHFLEQKLRLDVDFDLDALTFYYYFVLNVDWTSLSFVDFGLTIVEAV